MDQRQLKPEELRRCREGMRLSLPQFGERFGYKRMAVSHMENGRRHDTQQPVSIPLHVNLACGALWLGITGLSNVLEVATRADVRVGDELPNLPSGAIEPWHKEAAKQEVQRRGFGCAAGVALLVFPLLPVLAQWSQIVKVAPKRGGKVPKLHPLISGTVPAVAVLEFETEQDGTLFMTFFC